MTEPEKLQPVPDDEKLGATGAGEEMTSEGDAEPPPEPWTPERVSEWNAYYDFYVKAAALLLVFLVSCNYVTDAHVWLHLKTGQLIANQGAPVTTDVYSYTTDGQPWTNLAWLFQWGLASIYNTVIGLVPVNESDPTANRAAADQIAVGTLVVINALLRVLTVWLLLKIRRPGPGAWWSALVATVAFGVTLHPAYNFLMGGIAGPGSIAPRTVGLLLFAFEMYVLFAALFQGRSWMLWLLIPAFALWANVDSTFLTGLLVLAGAVIGYVLDGRRIAFLLEPPGSVSAGESGEPAAAPKVTSTGLAFLALGLSAIICLANPFTYRAYTTALHPYLQLLEPTGKITPIDLLSFFGPWVREHSGEQWYLLPAFYIIMVALGLGSFFLNWNRFSFTRFLPFVIASVIWGLFMSASAFFAVVFTAVVAINGQEWYQDRVGVEGRMGRGWTIWSTGGRLVTLGLIFSMMWVDITGWENTLSVVQFGAGYNPDVFPFDAAEFLASHSEIKGNVLNTSMAQGDVLIWKGYPNRKSYVDGRAQVFPTDLLEQWEKTRKALSTDDLDVWKPLLDQYQISVVLIETGSSPATYQKLMQSPNWVPFYDDGKIVMFGRADASAAELAFFKANRLDPDLRAYHTNHAVPGSERPPTPSTMIDGIFQNRTLSRLHTRTDSARRWLLPAGIEAASPPGTPTAIPEPARCLLAIQEARTALAKSPDDWQAFRMLYQAYTFLMTQEAAMLEGIPINAENQQRIRSVSPRLDQLMNRFQQRVTTLNYAIATTPPPKSVETRRELFDLNLQLFQLYVSANALDLARDRLQFVLDSAQPNDLPDGMRNQIQQQSDQLSNQMKQLDDQLVDLELERQAGQLDQAAFALSNGGAGKAIAMFADMERSNVSPAVVKPRLIDLYCNTGQPDKALELLSVGAIDDPNLGAEPGSGALRQGRVYFLLGNYISASTLWRERAIPRIRYERSNRVIGAGTILSRGQAMQAVDTLLTLPGTLSQQASWEYDLAMCDLEAGLPDEAATHFTKALNLAPDIAVRPIAAYYLEKMSKPVPAPSRRAIAAKQGAAAAAAGAKPGAITPPLESLAIDKAVVPPAAGANGPAQPKASEAAAAKPDAAAGASPKS
jgi:tetratricopeptide (TPR) repeat protein